MRGPGRLTQALGITGALDGKPLENRHSLETSNRERPRSSSGRASHHARR